MYLEKKLADSKNSTILGLLKRFVCAMFKIAILPQTSKNTYYRWIEDTPEVNAIFHPYKLEMDTISKMDFSLVVVVVVLHGNFSIKRSENHPFVCVQCSTIYSNLPKGTKRQQKHFQFQKSKRKTAKQHSEYNRRLHTAIKLVENFLWTKLIDLKEGEKEEAKPIIIIKKNRCLFHSAELKIDRTAIKMQNFFLFSALSVCLCICLLLIVLYTLANANTIKSLLFLQLLHIGGVCICVAITLIIQLRSFPSNSESFGFAFRIPNSSI